MKAIIHIGMAKTGSTSIQQWLKFNSAALEAKGVYSNEGMFPWALGRGRRELTYAIYQTARHELGVDEQSAWLGPRARNPEDDEKLLKNCKLLTSQLEDLSGEPGIFIYSYEVLYRCSEIQMIAIEKFFSRLFRDRTYVVYIRNTVDFLVSFYSEKLQNNFFYEQSTLPYSKFLKKCLTTSVPFGPESSFGNLFNWDKLLGDRLNVRLLESDWLVNGDLIDDFAYLVGVAPLGKPPKMNESFAAEYIEYVRFLNRKFRDKLPRAVRKKAIEILKDASSGKQKLATSDAQAKSIEDIHREQEEKIRTRFFPDRPFLFFQKFRGNGVAPVPLTWRRKAEIELEIRKKISPIRWEPYKLARGKT